MKVALEKRTDWSLSEVQPEKQAQLVSFLAKSIWQKNADPTAFYHWKYESNPQGKTLALAGFSNKEELIASSMFMPWKLFFRGKAVKACQWVDLFVSFRFRGHDIASKSLRMGLESFRRANSPVCFAFPNSNSVPVHENNAGIFLGKIARFTRPLNLRYLIERWTDEKWLTALISAIANFWLFLSAKETYTYLPKGMTFDKTAICGREFDQLWDKCADVYSSKIMTCKDSAYLNWKYINSPAGNRSIYALRKDGTLSGFVVLESTGSTGYIVEILSPAEKGLNLLIAQSIKHFRKEGKNSVVYVALEKNMYLAQLKAYGFIPRPHEARFYLYLDERLASRQDYLDPENWLVTIGDCDVDTL